MGQKCAIREEVLGSVELDKYLVGIGMENGMSDCFYGLFDIVGVDITPTISGLPTEGNMGHNDKCPHLVHIQQGNHTMEFPLAWVRLF